MAKRETISFPCKGARARGRRATASAYVGRSAPSALNWSRQCGGSCAGAADCSGVARISLVRRNLDRLCGGDGFRDSGSNIQIFVLAVAPTDRALLAKKLAAVPVIRQFPALHGVDSR